jgi:hypothetical protein
MKRRIRRRYKSRKRKIKENLWKDVRKERKAKSNNQYKRVITSSFIHGE